MSSATHNCTDGVKLVALTVIPDIKTKLKNTRLTDMDMFQLLDTLRPTATGLDGYHHGS